MAIVRCTTVKPFQHDFMMSTKPKVFLSAGFGAGKTFILVMKLFQLMKANYGLPGGLLVPNMKMFRRDVQPTIEEICRKFRVVYFWNSLGSFFYFPATRSKIYVFHDEDKGQSIKGPNLAFFLINEVTLCSEMGFKNALARVRLKRARLKQVAMSGTPEGFNWAYDYFIADHRSDSDVIFGNARLNQNVADDYYDMLEESFDPTMVKMYVEGQYVNLNGMAALYQFNRLKMTADDVKPDMNGEVWVSVDFNVSPMAATLWTWNELKSELRGFDEVNITNNADTHQLCNVIKQKLLDHGITNHSDVTLFPDPAGKSRGTRSAMTDIHILEEQGFKNLNYKTKIKSVRDCLNASNGFLKRNTVIMDRKLCKATIQDMEQVVMKGGTFELDKSDTKRTHWVDGFKNMIEYQFPVAHVKSEWRTHRAR